jgi:hypothetical protein
VVEAPAVTTGREQMSQRQFRQMAYPMVVRKRMGGLSGFRKFFIYIQDSFIFHESETYYGSFI